MVEGAAATAGSAGVRTIVAQLEARALRQGDRVALDDGSVTLTYAELRDAASDFAHRLRDAGLGPGSRLGTVAGSNLGIVLSLYGCAYAGVLLCPVPTVFTPAEMSRALSLLRVDALLVDPSLEAVVAEAGAGPVPRVAPDPDARSTGPPGHTPSPDDPCWILLTSGSTAFPKAALVPHRSPVASGQAYADAWGTGPDSVYLNFLPLFHTGGLGAAVMQCLVSGARLRLMPRGFEPGEALRIIGAERITCLSGFDVFWTRMRSHPAFSSTDFSSLEAVGIGGSLQTYEVAESLGVPRIVTAYACTEGGTLCITPVREADREVRKLANGIPIAGAEIRIVDPDAALQVEAGTPGEIVFRGVTRFLGYLTEPGDRANHGVADRDGGGALDPAVDAGGWYHSGDRGWLDAAGRLWFRGRLKQVVKTGGENVSCREVEVALETLCPEVVTAVVVGTPDAHWGEAVVAFVELAPGTALEPEAARRRLRAELAGFKVPKEVYTVPAGGWPVGGTGKVRREVLTAWAIEHRGIAAAAPAG